MSIRWCLLGVRACALAAAVCMAGGTGSQAVAEGFLEDGAEIEAADASGTEGPWITANGRTGVVTVTNPTPVSIAIQMNPGPFYRWPVDWWFISLDQARGHWYYLNAARQPVSFSIARFDCRPLYQGPLIPVGSTPLLNQVVFPVGTWQFWFGVDYPMDGILRPGGSVAARTVLVQVKKAPASRFVRIPSGSFAMGDTFNEGESYERPVHPVTVSAFYVEDREVTVATWEEVAYWARAHGYDLGNGQRGKGARYPVGAVKWYEAVKWCNARSEMEGRRPCYYTSVARTQVYRRGNLDLTPGCVLWSANGYRLPTEAEWERAARGGAAGRRFPWAGTDTISHARANYFSMAAIPYDVSPTRGYHPVYGTDVYDTNPAGAFAANGYGLYDMAGNAWEMCWDWFSENTYTSAAATNPRGPDTGSQRVQRGGGCAADAKWCRVSCRSVVWPTLDYDGIGFRCVRGP